MALPPSLPKLHITMIDITDRADGRVAYLVDQADLTRGQTDLSEIPFFAQELCGAACGADDLAAASLPQLDIVDECSDWDVRDRKAVAGADLRIRAGEQRITDAHVERCDNIALLTIGIVKQRQPGCAVRIVF